jgi:simple sugar transport system substrate-binding protein
MSEQRAGALREEPYGWLTRRQLVTRGGAVTGGLVAGGVLAACGDDDDGSGDAQAQKTDITVYSVTHGPPGDPYWSVYRKGIEDAGNAAGVNLEDVGPDKFSVQKVVDLLNSAIASKPDILVCAITDYKALDEPLRRAIDNGIPVIAIDVPDPRPASERIPYLFYVGGDEELGGQEAARLLLEQKKPARAACAIQEVGNIALEQRCAGYTQVMEEAGAAVDKLALVVGDPTRSSEILRGYFNSHDDAGAILTLGQDGFLPAQQVIRDGQLGDKVTHQTFDLSKEQLQALEEDEILSTISTQQYLMGHAAVTLATLNAEHGFTLAADMLTGPFLIQKSNSERVAGEVEEGYF